MSKRFKIANTIIGILILVVLIIVQQLYFNTRKVDTEETTASTEVSSPEEKTTETDKETEVTETEVTETEVTKTEATETEATATETTEKESEKTEPSETEVAETESVETENTEAESSETEATETEESTEVTTSVPETSIEPSTVIMPEPTTEAAYPVALIATVKFKTRYIGETLTGEDFNIVVKYSDESRIKNPEGWSADPLTLTGTTNTITVVYGELSTTVTVKAEEKPVYDPVYVFFGDSRFVGMKAVASPNDYFMALSGSGYTFMASKMEEIIAGATPACALVIGFGVNDGQYFIPQYIDAINSIAARYPGKVYFLTVNPVDEEMQVQYGYHKLNSMIDQFNATVIASLSSNITIIDTNTFLKEHGCSWVDGLHYTADTYRVIYDYIRGVVSATFNG